MPGGTGGVTTEHVNVEDTGFLGILQNGLGFLGNIGKTFIGFKLAEQFPERVGEMDPAFAGTNETATGEAELQDPAVFLGLSRGTLTGVGLALALVAAVVVLRKVL